MEARQSLACRLVACPESRGDGNEWSFYLINDTDGPFGWAVLDEVAYDWGGMGSEQRPDRRVTDVAPGGHALVWRDDDDAAEVNVDLTLRIKTGGPEMALTFEFPKLYKKRNLATIEGLGKPGWEEKPTRCSAVKKD